MRLIKHPAEFRNLCEQIRGERRSIGLVPTMGALHGGHGELIKNAHSQNDVVAVSIFVNPLQFDNLADLEKYPRNLETDLSFCSDAGVDIVFAPGQNDMHPEPILFEVKVREMGDILEGASRPGHFAGVVTVVTKLFILTGRCKAYFGEKDFQQLAIVGRLVEELHFPVEIVPVPVVREPSGLALSSRNERLNQSQRRAALALSRGLYAGRDVVNKGERSSYEVESVMVREVERMSEGLPNSSAVVLDYALVVDSQTLVRPDRISGPVRLLIAAKVGDVRLIDNMGANGDQG